MCPHSKRAYPLIRNLVEHYDGKVQARINVWCQPFHHQEVLLAKGVIAAGLINRSAGWRMLEQIYEHQDQFSDERVFNRSAAEIYNRLAELVERHGVEKRRFLEMVHSDEVMWRLKFMTHYGRQNGIHFSPSFMLQGLHIHEAESTWSMDKWRKLIDPIVKEVENYERTRGPEHLREAREHPSWESGHRAEHERYGHERGWDRGMFREQQPHERREHEPSVLDKVKGALWGDTQADRDRERRGQYDTQQQQSTERSGLTGKIKDAYENVAGTGATQDRGVVGEQRTSFDRDKGTTALTQTEKDKATQQLQQGPTQPEQTGRRVPIS